MGGDGKGPTNGGVGSTADAQDGELYRRLIEYSSDLISILAPDGEFRFVSPSVEEILGYEPTELLGTNALEYVHPEDRAEANDVFQELVEDPGETAELEYRYETAAGEWVWLETRGQNRLEDEVLDGVVTVSRDATGRIRRERALETLHDRTREMFRAESREDLAKITALSATEVLGYPITVVRLLTSDGQRLEPVAVTREADDVLGERPTYEVGEGTAGTAFADSEPKVYEDLQTLEDEFDRGDARSGLFVPIGDHGVLGVGHTEVGALDEADIQLGRILAANAQVAFDRLDRENELQRQNERLEEFASVISHDLRSPLNVATGRLDLLEADQEQVEPIRDALDRMEELIENVLTLARQGQAVDTTQPVDLADMAQRCWLNVATGDASMEVEADLAIEADPARLPEIFENLFRNAVEHGRNESTNGAAGEPDTAADAPTDTHAAESTNTAVTITIGELPNGFYVADDGPGIPDDVRDRIFESGFSTTSDGTGFGLAIVKEIAEAHGWQVALSESETGGARFEFTDVPLAGSE